MLEHNLVIKLFDSPSDTRITHWLRVYNPDRPWVTGLSNFGTPLYYSSLLGLANVSELILERGADVNAQGGHYGNALQAASCNGHRGVVELLLERGADVNAQGGDYGNALQAASSNGDRGDV